MAFAISFGNKSRSAFTWAAAALINPKALIKVRGIGMPLIGKLFTARCVCAPYSASPGMLTSPMLSDSFLDCVVMICIIFILRVNVLKHIVIFRHAQNIQAL